MPDIRSVNDFVFDIFEFCTWKLLDITYFKANKKIPKSAKTKIKIKHSRIYIVCSTTKPLK